MKPSFFSLYSRGRYRRQPLSLGAESSQASDIRPKRSREERERFAAAAIGFCIEHSLRFSNHFLRQICGKRIKLPKQTPVTVEIEPHRWADLRITTDSLVYVVECKIGAELADHQNPGHPKFAAAGGYGRVLKNEQDESGLSHRYIVLGVLDNLNLPRRHKRLGIGLSQISWEALVEKFPSSPLLDDLSKTLGQLGIPCFIMRNAKNLRIGTGLMSVGQALTVLNAVAESPELAECKLKTQHYLHEDDGWELGIYVRSKQSPTSFVKNLRRSTGFQDEWLAWFGYMPVGRKGTVKRHVYLYCSKQQKSEQLAKKLQAKFRDARAEMDGDAPCVIVRSSARKEEPDLDWFRAVFKCAGE